MVKIEDPITLFLLLLIVVASSLPTLIIASIFGFISVGLIFLWVTPLIPLFAFSGLGCILYGKTKTANPTLATVLLLVFVTIGLLLTLHVGYGLFRAPPPEGGW